MKKARIVAALVVSRLAATLSAATLSGANARTSPPIEARHVVLVRGSGWAEVIPRLQAANLKVAAVQNPLCSLEDSRTTRTAALCLQPNDHDL